MTRGSGPFKISGHHQLEAGGGIRKSARRAADQFKKNHLDDVPRPDAGADAAGDGVLPTPACQMHVENGGSIFIRKESSRPHHFMHMAQNGGLRNNGRRTTGFAGTRHQRASLVAPAVQEKVLSLNAARVYNIDLPKQTLAKPQDLEVAG